jgi:hypothetical protein
VCVCVCVCVMATMDVCMNAFGDILFVYDEIGNILSGFLNVTNLNDVTKLKIDDLRTHVLLMTGWLCDTGNKLEDPNTKNRFDKCWGEKTELYSSLVIFKEMCEDYVESCGYLDHDVNVTDRRHNPLNSHILDAFYGEVNRLWNTPFEQS